MWASSDRGVHQHFAARGIHKIRFSMSVLCSARLDLYRLSPQTR